MDDPLDQIDFARAVAEMNVYDPRFSGKHSCYPGVGRYPGKFFKGGLGGTVVGNCNFADADDFVQHHDVFSQASGQGLNGNLVGTGIGIGCDSFVFQGVSFGKECGHIPSDAVGADASDYGGDPVEDEIPQGCFRRSGVEAAFAASAQNVFMAVDEAGNRCHSFRLDFQHVHASAEIGLQIFSDCGDFSAEQKDVLHTGVFRLVHVCLSDKSCH